MSMTTQEIMEILPHRHPFLLIDFIDELEPGVRAVGYKSITFNELFIFIVCLPAKKCNFQ